LSASGHLNRVHNAPKTDAARRHCACRFRCLEAWIIDPTKMVRIALENALFVASVLLLTEATMTETNSVVQKRILLPLEIHSCIN
jgi:chaperonin GroEL (HSP60 family)